MQSCHRGTRWAEIVAGETPERLWYRTPGRVQLLTKQPLHSRPFGAQVLPAANGARNRATLCALLSWPS
jgi:hypothetical protein